MTHGRFGSYTSFFSERMKGFVASNAVTDCKQIALNGYEKAKTNVSEVIASESVQNVATTLKENAILGSNKFKKTITQVMANEKINKVSQQCHQYTESIADNYTLKKDKFNQFLESPEVLRLKSMFDGSMNAVLSTNLLFDLGLKFIPGADSHQFVWQSSKYLIACIIFMISTCQSYEVRKQNHSTHEHMGLYQSQVEEAYDVVAQLQKVFLHIETLLQEIYGQSAESSSITSKDFETVENDFSRQMNAFDSLDFNVFFKALLEGAAKTSWIQYLFKILSLSLPIVGSFNVLIVTAALVYTTVSALYKYQLRADNESSINLLQKQLAPIYAVLENLENKLYSDSDNEQDDVDDKIKTSDTSNKSSFQVDLSTFTEGVAKTSGLLFILQSLLRDHSCFNYVIYLGILCFEMYDLQTNKHKQENLDQSFTDLSARMEKLAEMIDNMKSLLLKQENYEKYLEESQKAKEDFGRIMEACKLEMRTQANEERRKEELKKLEEARNEELRKVELARQNEVNKLNEARKEKFRKAKLARQEERRKLEVARQQSELIELSPLPQTQPPFITHLKLGEEEQDVIKTNPTIKPTYFPAILGGLIGGGLGWVLGTCIATLLAVPTLGMSLAIPAICAFVSGVVSFVAFYRLSNSSYGNGNTMFYKKNDAAMPEQSGILVSQLR